MSLNVFHIVFVTCSVAITWGFSAWAFAGYRINNDVGYLATGITAIAAGIGLIIYGSIFLKKIKQIL